MITTKFKIILFVFVFVLLSTAQSFSGASFDVTESDTADDTLTGFFDLRDRETFIQITNFFPESPGQNIHIQIFDVSNNCNENDFFDFYTPNDTHIYNLRDIVTNDGNPSGVVLPDGAYGVFIAHSEDSNGDQPDDQPLIGNMRILDDSGYEYRTNLVGEDQDQNIFELSEFATFNFNTKGGVTLSDVVGIPFDDDDPLPDQENAIADVLNIWSNINVDIYDLNEIPFSCRNVVFACVNQDHPLLEELLEEVNDTGDGSANVASFEYGINNAIPHSRGGELLCPGNIITEGFVRFEILAKGDPTEGDAIYYVGLNNGNGRGSIDSIWFQNKEINAPPMPPPG